MKKKRNSTFVNNLITYLIVIVAFVAVRPSCRMRA